MTVSDSGRHLVCACCGCIGECARFRTSRGGRFCHYLADASSILLLPVPLPPDARVCRLCHQVSRYPATAARHGVPIKSAQTVDDHNLSTTSMVSLLVSLSSGPARPLAAAALPQPTPESASSSLGPCPFCPASSITISCVRSTSVALSTTGFAKGVLVQRRTCPRCRRWCERRLS